MASRKERTALGRSDPNLRAALRLAYSDAATAQAIEDAVMEGGHRPETSVSDLFLSQFEVGKTYWMETAVWVYVGVCLRVGADYIVLGRAARMHSDGRHHLMMKTGTAPNLVMEASGGPTQEIRIPVDWIGPHCEWPFETTETSTS